MLHIYSYIARMYYFCQLKLWPVKWQLLNLYTYWSTHYPRRYLTMLIRTPRETEVPEMFGSLLLESLLWGSAVGRGPPPRKRTWDPQTPVLCRGLQSWEGNPGPSRGCSWVLDWCPGVGVALGNCPKKRQGGKECVLPPQFTVSCPAGGASGQEQFLWPRRVMKRTPRIMRDSLAAGRVWRLRCGGSIWWNQNETKPLWLQVRRWLGKSILSEPVSPWV